jgi:Holliday junction DNA helicase RuvA
LIGLLQGKLLHAAPEKVLLDVHGVGYEVHIPLSTYYEIERAGADGGAVRLFIHTHVREDAIALFGFWSAREKQVFERLLGVTGIGPRNAQVILSGMAPDDLAAAIAASDVARLTTIPGVGKKTAERMVVELRDRMQEFATQTPAAPPSSEDDLVTALVHLGYRQAQAERAVLDARRDSPEAAFHELLRLSLKRLSRV